jgi:hypothetical protein
VVLLTSSHAVFGLGSTHARSVLAVFAPGEAISVCAASVAVAVRAMTSRAGAAAKRAAPSMT